MFLISNGKFIHVSSSEHKRNGVEYILIKIIQLKQFVVLQIAHILLTIILLVLSNHFQLTRIWKE